MQMQTIWKYLLEITDEQYIQVPRFTKPLTVQMQDGVLCLWCLIYPDNKQDRYVTVSIFGTGNPIKEMAKNYLGTVQNDGLVWHVFVS